MSVEKNIAFGLVMDKMLKGEIETRVQEMLKPSAGELPSASRISSSGGQRQRVALARSPPSGPRCCCSTNRSAR